MAARARWALSGWRHTRGVKMSKHRLVGATLREAVRNPNCPGATLEGAWQVAHTTNDVTLAVMVALHPQATSTIVTALCSATKPQLRAAWARRPDTDPTAATALVLTCRDSAVLAALCRQGLTGYPHLTDALLQRLRAGASAALVDAALMAAEVPLTVKGVAAWHALELRRSRALTVNLVSVLRQVHGSPQAAEAFLTAGDDTVAIPVRGVPILGAAGVSAPVRIAAISRVTIGGATGVPLTKLVSTVLEPPDVQSEVLDALVDLARRHGGKAALQKIARYRTTPPRPPRVQGVDEAAGRVRNAAALTSFVHRYRHHPELLDALEAMAVRVKSSAFRQDVLKELASRDRARAVSTLRTLGDDALAAAVYANDMTLFATQSWAGFVDRDRAPALVWRVLTSSCDPARRSPAAVASLCEFVRDEELLDTPWSVVECLTNPEYDRRVANRVVQALAAEQSARFTAPEHWLTWSALASSFTGTARELVATAAAL